jgi:exosome complex RNA-binding protein Csl4
MAALIASTNSIVKADENVIILSQTTFTEYYSGGGAYHVFGEVQNIGNQAVRYNITATFYNSKMRLLSLHSSQIHDGSIISAVMETFEHSLIF